jgi:GLPGLI family protein
LNSIFVHRTDPILFLLSIDTAIIEIFLEGYLITLYTYLINDSIRKIDWKMGSEMRNIAGFNCRKAVGKVLDSIIVIAFYAEEIVSAGGPESFAGLPGMILGVAIPKMHTTWYATKVQVIEPKPVELAAPKKGKKMQAIDFSTKLNDLLKNYGPELKRMQWQLLL